MLATILAATVTLVPGPAGAARPTPEMLAEIARLRSPACRAVVLQHAAGPQALAAQPLARMPVPQAEKAVMRQVQGCVVPVHARFVRLR